MKGAKGGESARRTQTAENRRGGIKLPHRFNVIHLITELEAHEVERPSGNLMVQLLYDKKT